MIGPLPPGPARSAYGGGDRSAKRRKITSLKRGIGQRTVSAGRSAPGRADGDDRHSLGASVDLQRDAPPSRPCSSRRHIFSMFSRAGAAASFKPSDCSAAGRGERRPHRPRADPPPPPERSQCSEVAMRAACAAGERLPTRAPQHPIRAPAPTLSGRRAGPAHQLPPDLRALRADAAFCARSGLLRSLARSSGRGAIRSCRTPPRAC